MVIVPASPFLTPSKMQENNLTSSLGSIRVFARIRPFIENEKTNRLTNLSIVHSGSNAAHSSVTPQRGDVFLNQAETPLIRNISRSQNALSSSRTQNLVSNHTLFLPNDAIPNTIVAKRVGMTRDFTCNAAFNYDASQKDVYDKSIGQSIRNNIFNGYNTTIFAYGQKNSGKTFTMLGRREADISNLVNHESHSFINSGSDNLKTSFSNEYFIHEDDGVIPRAIHDLFKAKQRQDLIGDISIKMNVIEMHNDELKDLLIDKNNSELKVRDVGDDGFLIEGLTHVDLKSAKHARDVISRAFGQRQSIEKKIAIRPSSSHTICQFIVTTKPFPSDNGITRKKQFLTSKLTMVDLAASDSINKFDLDKRESRRESVNINKDLFVLGKVLAAIADNSFTSRTNHIPFRDSKLTMVLSDSLRIPTDDCFEDSLNTLRYAERTKISAWEEKCTSRGDSYLEEYYTLRDENEMLKSKMHLLERRLNNKDPQLMHWSATSNEIPETLRINPSSTLSGNTAESTTDCESLQSFEGNQYKSISQKVVSFDHLRSASSDSEFVLRIKGSLLDQTSPAPQLVVKKAQDVIYGEQRIAKSLRAENDKLRKDNKAMIDSIQVRQLESQYLQQTADGLRAEIKDLEVRAGELQKTSGVMGTFYSTQREQPQRSNLIENQIIEMSVIKKKEKRINSSNLHEFHKEHIPSQEAREGFVFSDAALEEQKSESYQRIAELESEINDEKEEREKIEKRFEQLSTKFEALLIERNEALKANFSYLQEKENYEQRIRAKDVLIDELRKEISEKHGICDVESDYEGILKNIETSQCPDDLSETLSSMIDYSSTAFEPPSTHRDIRIHAAKMLYYANKAIEKCRNESSTNSLVSSIGSEYNPDVKCLTLSSHMKGIPSDGKPPLPNRHIQESQNKNKYLICDIEKVKKTKSCSCFESIFSGNAEHVDFYLPKLGLACSCGGGEEESSTIIGTDPTTLVNILRAWQVDFLASVNLHNAVDLIHAYNQRPGKLAKAMKTWRKVNNLPPVKTKSCQTALYIWSRTCKAVVLSVRKQKVEGSSSLKRPEFLVLTSDGGTVSTIGCNSLMELKTEFIEL